MSYQNVYVLLWKTAKTVIGHWFHTEYSVKLLQAMFSFLMNLIHVQTEELSEPTLLSTVVIRQFQVGICITEKQTWTKKCK